MESVPTILHLVPLPFIAVVSAIPPFAHSHALLPPPVHSPALLLRHLRPEIESSLHVDVLQVVEMLPHPGRESCGDSGPEGGCFTHMWSVNRYANQISLCL